jgi:DNA polymerase phi
MPPCLPSVGENFGKNQRKRRPSILTGCIAATANMSKKRKRDASEIDVDVVKIYDKLADEDESTRLAAARQLIAKVFQPDSTSTDEQITTIVKRLFRGLCSSRKAARLGFAVALTEFLAQLQSSDHKSLISPEQAVSLLETCTAPDGGMRGQDERDHYFGRVFGADALIKSHLLFGEEDRTQWRRVLDLLCGVALKKPWLRQECGWIMCQLAVEGSQQLRPFVEDIVEALNTNKLIRTPEGVAIWLTARKSYPDAKLSKHAWKYSHPLAAKDAEALAEVMKNAKTQQEDSKFGAQGSTSWTASLHFAWLIVLQHFFASNDGKTQASGKSKQNQDSHELMTFEQFWEVVVDNGLFSANSSAERKLWGVLLFSRAIIAAPGSLVPPMLQERTVHYLFAALAGEDRYHRKSAQTALQALEKRVRTSGETTSDFRSPVLQKLLKTTKFVDFDSTTKTKVVATLLDGGDPQLLWLTLRQLRSGMDATVSDQQSSMKHLLALESKLLASILRRSDGSDEPKFEETAVQILSTWLSEVEQQPQNMQQFVRDRVSAGLEQAVKAGSTGRSVFRTVLSLEKLAASTTDESLRGIVQQAHKKQAKLDRIIKKQNKLSTKATLTSRTTTSLAEGFHLLYCIVGYDISNGESESVEIMQDLLEIDVINQADESAATDGVVEILLSFSSRPSKFLRTAAPLIFEAIASGLTHDGLSALTRILETRENAQGQEEMFEAAANESAAPEDEEGDEDQDAMSVDSDVEVVDAEDDSSDSDVDSGEDSDSSPSAQTEDDKDEQLEAFEAALASALGTTREMEGAESDSDADMNDDEMMALDEKLTEVFKARKEATSKKKDRKDAKETVVNFKNRVLDLLEVYIKHEHKNPNVVHVVLPLLRTIRTTQTKQLAERSMKALRDLCGRCKGHVNVPAIGGTGDLAQAIQCLQEIHEEAGLEASNMHSAVASLASLLLVKVLVKAGVPIERMINVYAKTLNRMMTDPKCKIQSGFFTDWQNWCVSSRAWTIEKTTEMKAA